jgi:hypothetical protein
VQAELCYEFFAENSLEDLVTLDNPAELLFQQLFSDFLGTRIQYLST